MDYYIADTHFGHNNVIQFDNRPFSNSEEMDQSMIQLWNNKVTNDDHVYILGDFCFRSTKDPAWYLQQLKGKKHLIQGNHDHAILKSPQAMSQFLSIEKMTFIQDGGYKLVLCHFPLAEWNGFYKGVWHLYGHIHNRTAGAGEYMRKQQRALNAGCMLNGYTPVTLGELMENNRLWKAQTNLP